jgi:UDP-N-acetylglucosamine 1-carboxyvinyltransferase
MPDIGDVRVALSILEDIGAVIFKSRDCVFINTDKAFYKKPDPTLVSEIRASTYLMGACLARFHRFDISSFGGCNFSARPIDMHLFAASSLGAEIDGNCMTARGLCGNEINFRQKSVGATVNAILMAQGAVGTTVIRSAAKEPHIMFLVDFLNSCGGDIRVEGDTFIIRQRDLISTKIRLIGDMIEAGTYIALSLLTNGRISIRGVNFAELSGVIEMLKSVGASVAHYGDTVYVQGRVEEPLFVNCGPYPEFPTDLQPIFAPLMTRCGGKIIDNVWQERFGYLDALGLFGVGYLRIPKGAIIYPSHLKAASATATDLRGGAACVLAALAAEGESTVYSAQKIMRGYADLTRKLRALGADISLCDRTP